MFKIKNIKIKNIALLAPMAGITNAVYRKFCYKLGAGTTCTEMISNLGLKYNSQKTLKLAQIDKNEKKVAIQIFGGNVEEYVEAAKYFDKNSKAKMIDINLGCPVKKVAIKSQAGAALTRKPSLVYKIIKNICQNINKPLTIKIRLGWDKNNLTHIKIAKLAEKAGASAIIVHGRTREDMFKNYVDLQKIKEVKEAVNIPVIGNGDIKTPEDALHMLKTTNVDGIMIAREARDNPWIFKQINQYFKKNKYKPYPNLKITIKNIKKIYKQLIKFKGSKIGLLESRGIAHNWLKRFKKNQSIKQEILKSQDKKTFFDNLKKYKILYFKK